MRTSSPLVPGHGFVLQLPAALATACSLLHGGMLIFWCLMRVC
jgi:hypothetical protein